MAAAFWSHEGSERWRDRVLDTFQKQTFMHHLGAKLTALAPGEVEITISGAATELRQHHGFFHAGVTTSIADSAAGCAALTLFPEDKNVVTTEFKINLLRPAGGQKLVARGRVIKSGQSLSICGADVYTATDDSSEAGAAGGDGSKEVHVATALLTMIPTAAIGAPS